MNDDYANRQSNPAPTGRRQSLTDKAKELHSDDMVLKLVEELHRRRQRGLEVYGKPVDPDSEDVEFWLRNAVEEGIDQVLYQMAALVTVRKMRLRITELEEKLTKAEDRITQLERDGKYY